MPELHEWRGAVRELGKERVQCVQGVLPERLRVLRLMGRTAWATDDPAVAIGATASASAAALSTVAIEAAAAASAVTLSTVSIGAAATPADVAYVSTGATASAAANVAAAIPSAAASVATGGDPRLAALVLRRPQLGRQLVAQLWAHLLHRRGLPRELRHQLVVRAVGRRLRRLLLLELHE